MKPAVSALGWNALPRAARRRRIHVGRNVAGRTAPRGSRWPRLLAPLFLAAACAGGAVCVWHKMHHHVPPATLTVAADPRLAAATPYRNVRPDVRYVGDAVCAGCHHDIAKTYRHHPMAQR